MDFRNENARVPDSPLKEKVIAALRSVFDPEIPVNIFDLGLIYGLEINGDGEVFIRMTLTSPNCPEAESLPSQVQIAAQAVEGIRSANVELVWEPPFTMDMLSEAARLQLNL